MKQPCFQTPNLMNKRRLTCFGAVICVFQNIGGLAIERFADGFERGEKKPAFFYGNNFSIIFFISSFPG